MPWAARFALSQHVKGSLWVLPLLGGLLGGVLAQGALFLDGVIHLSAGWNYTASTASGVLTAIVGAMVALLGFVVTIGVLVVQQATGTLSPRYMRLWYRDRLQKVVLATFTGTFTFAFSLLRQVGDDFVPDIGVTMAGFLVLTSLGLLLIYLDRFTHNMRPVAVAALVSRSGQEVLTDWVGKLETYGMHPGPDTQMVAQGPVWHVLAEQAGAVQAVNLNALVAEANQHDYTIVLRTTVGDFVTTATVLADVHGMGLVLPQADQLRRQFAFGRERTIEQDPAFAMRVLVDIATKALSPAINDPTTAVQVLDHIEAFLEVIARTELCESYALDTGGVTRLVIPGRAWEDYLQLAITEVRDYGASSIQVCRRLRALLEAILAVAPPDRRPPVEEELRRLAVTVEATFTDPKSRELASAPDRQGIGGRTQRTSCPPAAGEKGTPGQRHDRRRPEDLPEPRSHLMSVPQYA